MKNPSDLSLPFFAYGLFKPGQLSFFQVQEYVQQISDYIEVKGDLLIRDGIPILNPNGRKTVFGNLISFDSLKSEDAYSKIAQMEPEKHYCWKETFVKGQKVNLLVGRSSNKGSSTLEGQTWDGWSDPLFKEAFEVIDETLTSQERNMGQVNYCNA